MTAKYDRLAARLADATSPSVLLSFDEIHLLVGGLPDSALQSRTWWANTLHASRVQAQAWLGAGWKVQAVDFTTRSVHFGRLDTKLATAQRGTTTRNSAGPNGVVQLADVLRAAGYASTMHAVAAHTVMLHPGVVEQSGGQAIFRTVRRDPRKGEQVGTFGVVAGAQVMFDDNLSPIAAFIWATNSGRGTDTQYNHIWPASRDASAYTALWNICCTPAFVAKTTDGRHHPEVIQALRRRAFEMYGYKPADSPDPTAPDRYDELQWAPHPTPVESLESAYRHAMSTKPKDRVVISARQLGWRYSDWTPDPSL